MAYDISKLVRLKALKALAERWVAKFATKESVESLETSVNKLIDDSKKDKSLNDLKDVSVNSPFNNQTLLYDVQNKVFKNASLSKKSIGLDAVDNTSDSDKEVFSATQLAFPYLIDGMPFDGTEGICRLCICETSPDIRTKEVTLPGFTPVEGATIRIIFKYQNEATPSPLQLSVNGMRYPITFEDGTSYKLVNDVIYTFVFHSNRWHCVGCPPVGSRPGGYAVTHNTDAEYGYSIVPSTRGTWMPSIYGLYTNEASGGWFKIGSYVHCWFHLDVPYQKATTGGAISFSGLPFIPSIVSTLNKDPSDENLRLAVSGSVVLDSPVLPVLAGICLTSYGEFCLVNNDCNWFTGVYWNSVFTESSGYPTYISGNFSYLTDEE